MSYFDDNENFLIYGRSRGCSPYYLESERKYMSKDTTTVFVTGKLYWFKALGDKHLHQNYDGDAREWSYELEPEDTSFLKEHGLLDRLKDPMDYVRRLEKKGEDEKAEKARKAAEGRGDYLVLRKPELNYEGEKNDPIRVYDSDGRPWDEDVLIGNETVADVKLTIKEWGKGKKSSIYTTAIRIQDHVEYESDEFAAMDSNKDETPKKTTKAKAKSSGGSKAKKASSKTKGDYEDLDDDIPF